MGSDIPGATKLCIAVLDDNSDIRLVIRTMLESKYVVADFETAAGLLEFLEHQKCDLIVSDLSLPQTDGFDFISVLKKNEQFASIPVVAFTASGSDGTRRRALAAGFVAYLVKPASMCQLLSVIAKNLPGS